MRNYFPPIIQSASSLPVAGRLGFLPRLLAKRLNEAAKKLCSIICGVPADEGLGISNLGKYEMNFDTFSLIKMWFVPPLFAMNDFVVGVFTINSKMTFCLRYSAALIDHDAVTRLFETARHSILNN